MAAGKHQGKAKQGKADKGELVGDERMILK
jgi:hypothetical protein